MSTDNFTKLVIEGYHGTDQKYVTNIIDNGFICKTNDEHWLGNGIYLFTDISLSKWWTSNPSKNFGSNIDNPAIIKCLIEVDSDEVLDLRKLSDYERFVDVYREEFIDQFFTVHIEIDGDKEKFAKRIRCAYCDYLKRRFNLKMLIGNFYKPEQPYLPRQYGELFEKFDIKYIETQICIFNQDIIVNKAKVSL
jgi:hypothetical protein